MTSLLMFTLLAAAPGPKLTGTYFPVPAADRIKSGDYRPADLAMAVSFKADEVWIHWPTEDANLKWRAGKAGIEVTRWNGTVNPVSWTETADGTVTTEVFYADGDKPQAMVVKWVPDSFDTLVDRWESGENKKAFKLFAGTWGRGSQKLIIGPDKVTWGDKVVGYRASACREKCGEVAATTCLSPPRKVTGLPTFALIDGAIVEVTWSSICSVTPGEAWGFERVAKGVELRRK